MSGSLTPRILPQPGGRRNRTLASAQLQRFRASRNSIQTLGNYQEERIHQVPMMISK